jgi:hypothetical protein
MTTPTTNFIPKQIHLKTPIVKDNRTLILLDNQDTSVNWSKWSNLVVNMEGYKKWSQFNTNIVGIILTDLNDTEEAFDELYNISKRVTILFVSQNVLDLKSEEYWAENFDNIINLSDTVNMYPFIEEAWDGSVTDALSIAALITRHNRIICSSTISNRTAILDKWNIRCETNVLPNTTWLFTQFFKHQNNRRHREIRECLQNNCNNPLIDKIVLINEMDYSDELSTIKNNDKTQQIITGRRLTYSDFIEQVSLIAPDNCHVILANADIYFGDSLKGLWNINIADKMLALLRWDIQEDRDEKPQLFGPRFDSQDSWIFLSNSIKSKEWNKGTFNYKLGTPGCDNRFTADIMRMRFVISNPALSIKSYHIHNTKIRNYTMKDSILSSLYVFIEPSYILDTKQVTTPTVKPEYINNETIEFEINSSSMSNAITYCTLLEKGDRFKWEAGVENYYFDKIPFYTWKNSCVTSNGLVYDLWNIYTGKHGDKYNYWAETNTDIFSPLSRCNRLLAIPFKDNSYLHHPDTYALQYLSRVSRFLENDKSSFWVPENFYTFVKNFDWKHDISCVKYKKGEMNAVYADEVVGWLPGPYELAAEDIQSLRGLYPDWKEVPVGKKCVVLTNSILNSNFITGLQGILEDWDICQIGEKDYCKYDEIVGASLCIFIGGKNKQNNWSKLWCLPKGCCVVEFQEEAEIDGEFQHLAHISGFTSWIYLLPKLYGNQLQKHINEMCEKWYNKHSEQLI